MALHASPWHWRIDAGFRQSRRRQLLAGDDWHALAFLVPSNAMEPLKKAFRAVSGESVPSGSVPWQPLHPKQPVAQVFF